MSETTAPAEKTTFHPPGGWFRTLVPWTVWLWVGIAVVLTVISVYLGSADGRGELGILGVYMATAVLPTAWGVLQPMWRDFGDVPGIWLSLTRIVVIPVVAGIPVGIAAGLTVLMPVVAERIAATTREDGWHFWFGSDRGANYISDAFVLGAIGSICIAMIAGLAIAVTIVLPGIAFFNPRKFSRENLLDDSEENRAVNATASRFLAVLIFLIFAVPTMIVVGMNESWSGSFGEMLVTWPMVFTNPEYYWGDALWFLGVVLVPVGIVLMFLTRAAQRPDRAARARLGVNAYGDEPDDSSLEERQAERR